MRFDRRWAACGFLMVCLSMPARADLSYLNKGTIGYTMASALPTKPMAQGALDVHLSPAYAEFKGNESDPGLKASGPGFGASVLYSLTDHWGIGGLIGYAKMRGTDSNSDRFTATGYSAGANIVYDPFSGDNFRFPIMAGLAYDNDKETVNVGNAAFGQFPANSVFQYYVGKSPGWIAGLAPQFNTGPLRWVVFGFAIQPFHKPVINNPNAGSNNGSDGGASGAGVSVIYRPLNMALTYIPSFANDVGHGETNSVYAINYQQRFQLGLAGQ